MFDKKKNPETNPEPVRNQSGTNQEGQMAKKEEVAPAHIPAAQTTTVTPAPEGRLDALTALIPSDTTRSLLLPQLAQLPAEIQQNIVEMLQRMSPNKKGMEEGMSRGWSPMRIKIYQAVSRDNIPKEAKLGDLYTSGGTLLTKPLRFTPVYMHKSRAMFDTVGSLKCSSNDGKISRDGQMCESCPHNKERDGNGRSTCSYGIDVYVFDPSFSNLYLISFSKTNFMAGDKLRKLVETGVCAWERWYELGTKEETGQGKKYFKYEVAPTSERVDSKMVGFVEFVNQSIVEQRANMRAEIARNRANGVARVTNADTGVTAPAVAGSPDFEGSI